MTTAAPCPSCRQIVPLDPHLADCEVAYRAPRDLGPQPYQVARVARDARGAALEELLETCNRRARAWLKVRGRSFP